MSAPQEAATVDGLMKLVRRIGLARFDEGYGDGRRNQGDRAGARETAERLENELAAYATRLSLPRPSPEELRESSGLIPEFVAKNLAPTDPFHPQFVAGFWNGHSLGRARGKAAAIRSLKAGEPK